MTRAPTQDSANPELLGAGLPWLAAAAGARPPATASLVEVVTDLAGAADGRDLHQALTRGLRALTGGDFAVFSRLDQATRCLWPTALDLAEGLQVPLLRELQGGQAGLVSGTRRAGLLQAPIAWRQPTAELLAFVPPRAAGVLQRSGGRWRLLGLALVHAGELLGTALVGLPVHAPTPPPGTVEAFARAATAALARAQVESVERKRAELDRSRLAMAIEQAGEVIVVTDTDGAIQYVNPAFEAVTGYASAEVLGQNPRLLKSGAQGGDFYRDLWATIRAGKTWRGTLVNRRKDGRRYTEEASISPVRDAAGEVTAYVAVKRDISRGLALETQLLQARKLEGIGRLAGGVAHDFNNVLAVILSCAGFALKELPSGAPLREELSEIQGAARRAAELTRQLLAFSRRQVLQPVPLDLNLVIADMERMLRRIIGEDVELVLDLAGGLGSATVDPSQLEQVVMNLVVNAREAMPGGGRLTVGTRNVHLDAEACAGREGLRPGPHVAVTVADSGVGMDAETAARVFEPFFTTKGLGQGTGLGLATVYGIVKQSGGAISVQSAPGAGTTFELVLPRGPGPALRSPAPAPTAPVAGGAETILLVEDDPSVRAMAQRILAEAGYQVLVAGNGEEALLICAQDPRAVDLLLTDVVMPVMGGKALAEQLDRVRPGTKVLFMSGYTGGALDHQGVLEQGARLIGKPFGIEDLRREVRAALDARTAPGPGVS